MVELVRVNKENHADLRVKQNAYIEVAAGQHVVNIRASEVGRAACALPVFLSRNPATGALALSAVCGIEPGINLFVDGSEWLAAFVPGSMTTYPLFLMRDESNDKGYVVGIDESSDAFSRTEGERLFEESGTESLYLSKIAAMLEAAVEDDIQSFHFLKMLDELGLQKAIDLVVYFDSGDTQTIKGLSTIDEDKLHALSATQLADLNEKGYLIPIHAMLISLFQLNRLIRRYGKRDGEKTVTQIKLEIARDASSDY